MTRVFKTVGVNPAQEIGGYFVDVFPLFEFGIRSSGGGAGTGVSSGAGVSGGGAGTGVSSGGGVSGAGTGTGVSRGGGVSGAGTGTGGNGVVG